MNKKPIKEMTPDEYKEYRHEVYLRRREKIKKYNEEHKEEISFKNKNRYRIKCGLPPLKKKGE